MLRIRKQFIDAHPDLYGKLLAPEYDFLNENEHLGDNILLLALGGSHAYGLNTPESDLDIRGIAFNSKTDLLGLTHFDQVVEPNTDTTIYSLNKMFGLLMECNPNIIEILGLRDEDYLYISPEGQELLDNKDIFLSKKAEHTFSGYAYAQLKRLQNATARDSLSEADREQHILHSINKQIGELHQTFDNSLGAVRLSIGDAVSEGHTKEILMSGNFEDYPLRAFNQLYNAMNQVCKDYDHLDNRNRKKDDKHLNKHAAHLVRLYQMAFDILEKGEINTRRTGEDLQLLKDIRAGKYMKDSVMIPEFYQMVDELDAKLNEVSANSKLPKKVDFEKCQNLLVRLNEKSLERERKLETKKKMEPKFGNSGLF